MSQVQIPLVECEDSRYCAHCGAVIKELQHTPQIVFDGFPGQMLYPMARQIPGAGRLTFSPCGHSFWDYGYVLRTTPRGAYMPKHAKVIA